MIKKYDYPEGSLISFMSNKVKRFGGINLAQGIPGFEPPSRLKEILSELAMENIHQYPPGIGDLKLQEQILMHYNKINPEMDADNLLVTQGATEGIYLTYQYLKQIINEDFSVLAFDPLYESYKYLPGILNDKLVIQDLKILLSFDYTTLKEIIQNENIKIVFLASPGNPYGKGLDESNIKKLIQLAEELNFYILFDAVYKDLYFKKMPFSPLDELSPNVFYINSFSKMLSVTGWRIGYLIHHRKHRDKLRYVHDYTGLCAPSVLQRAIAIYLEESNYGEEYLDGLRAKLKEAYGRLSVSLNEAGFNIPHIDGGYFIWAKLPNDKMDSFQWAMNLYEQHKVATIPGMHFSEKGKQYVRFNIAREIDEINIAGGNILAFSQQLADF